MKIYSPAVTPFKALREAIIEEARGSSEALATYRVAMFLSGFDPETDDPDGRPPERTIETAGNAVRLAFRSIRD